MFNAETSSNNMHALPKAQSEDFSEPLTKESVLRLWSKTYNANGKPDWSHIFPYYHPDIVFQDSIQRIEGYGNFTAMCARLARRCKQLKMDIGKITQIGRAHV